MSETVPCTTACPVRSGRVADASEPGDPGGPAIAGHIPFRSPLREQVLETICQPCWDAWLDVQIKVINELALNLGDPRSHEIIEAHARDFLGLSDGETGMDFATLGDEPPESTPTPH